MSTVPVNNDLELVLPDGFRILNLEELKKTYSVDYDCMWGTRDEERHILLSVIWKVSNKIISTLASAKLVANQTEKSFRRRFRKVGYHGDGRFETQIAGLPAWGFRYGYTIEGQPQTCETIAVQDGTCCYTIMYHTRDECAQDNRAIYEQILASMKLNH